MKRYLLKPFIALFLSVCPYVNAGEYETCIMDEMVRSLQVYANNESRSLPLIELNGSDQILIKYDILTPEMERCSYSIIHCDADWSQSALNPIEYMNGFQSLPIEDFSSSINTTVQYVNYQLLLPNEDVQFRVSGNYVVKVFKEDNPSEVLFTACFSVVDKKVSISATSSSMTDIDSNRSHQQVSFLINHRNYQIINPTGDLKIRVYQNRRRDNMVSDVKPSKILPDGLEYSHNRSLIFDGGNEYRRFEFLSNRYNGMHVDHVSFHNPYYHVNLMKDLNRNTGVYEYDQDQDGLFFLSCSSCNEADTEADYYVVHFAVDSPKRLNGHLYLNGDLFQNRLEQPAEMEYNEASGQYEKAIFLKQGNYNYQYLFVPDEGGPGQSSAVEGNYYQTENEYSIYVYHRPIGAKYDMLIGVTVIRNTMEIL